MAEDKKNEKKPVEAPEAEKPVNDQVGADSPVDATSSSRPKEEKPADTKERHDGDADSAEIPAKSEKSTEPDWKTLYALTLADFDNYKKRAARDREDVYRYAESDILKDVLPAIDNLQLALDAAKDRADDPFVKGVLLVYDTLLKSLKDHGAEPFDSVGQELDTGKMEAIATLPSDAVEEGRVSIESKKGWMLKDKVLRAAQVVVSSGKPQ